MDQGSAVSTYEPVQPHWVYQTHVDGQDLWVAFSQYDSDKLNQGLERGECQWACDMTLLYVHVNAFS